MIENNNFSLKKHVFEQGFTNNSKTLHFMKKLLETKMKLMKKTQQLFIFVNSVHTELCLIGGYLLPADI